MQDKNYKVLATKYRPSNFDSLIGQEVLVRTLSNAIESNKIANAFILTGIRGVGKTTTARIIAKALNCLNEDNITLKTSNPCGKCENCKSIAEDRHPDIIEIDAASHTGVDDIRTIIENTKYLPVIAKYKIFIIDEVHMLSKSAFNALLKTLEEPPKHVKFIFATTEIRKIPVTIISRCQRFDLKRVEDEVLVSHLQKVADSESRNIDNQALHLIASASEGSVRDSLSMLDQAFAYNLGDISIENIRQMLGVADNSQIHKLFENIAGGKAKEALEIFDNLYIDGCDCQTVIQELAEHNYLLTKLLINPEFKSAKISDDKIEHFKEIAKKLGINYLSRSWQVLVKGIEEVKFSSTTNLAAQMLIIRLVHLSDLPTVSSIIEDIKKKPKITAQQQVVEQEEPKNIDNFTDLINLFKSKKEALLHYHLADDVKPVKVADNVFEYNSDGHLPKNFNEKVKTCLDQWTGKIWKVAKSDEQGGLTMFEQKQLAKDNLKKEIEATKDVQNVLQTFEGATIMSIE